MAQNYPVNSYDIIETVINELARCEQNNSAMYKWMSGAIGRNIDFWWPLTALLHQVKFQIKIVVITIKESSWRHDMHSPA